MRINKRLVHNSVIKYNLKQIKQILVGCLDICKRMDDTWDRIDKKLERMIKNE